METALRFFLQPEEVKRAASRGSFAESGNHGWVSLETERWDGTRAEPEPGLTWILLIRTLFFRLNPQRPGDLKEAYNTCVLTPDAVPAVRVCVCVCVVSRGAGPGPR